MTPFAHELRCRMLAICHLYDMPFQSKLEHADNDMDDAYNDAMWKAQCLSDLIATSVAASRDRAATNAGRSTGAATTSQPSIPFSAFSRHQYQSLSEIDETA